MLFLTAGFVLPSKAVLYRFSPYLPYTLDGVGSRFNIGGIVMV